MKTTLPKKPLLTLILLMAFSLSSISVTAQRSFMFTEALPAATIKTGETQVLTTTVITPANENNYVVKLVRKQKVEPWKEDEIVVVAGQILAPTSGTVMTFDFKIPADVLEKFPVDADHSYNYVTGLFNASWGDWTGDAKEVIITSALSTKSYNKNLNVLAQNPVGNQLILNSNDFKYASIFDISGRKVMEFNTAGNNIEVSQLTKGIYFLVSNNNVKAKFLKK